MKRSEMLEIIKNQWIDSTSFPTDYAVAKYILDAIEKAGMLPPPTKIDHITDNLVYIYYRDGQSLDSEDPSSYWESEDV